MSAKVQASSFSNPMVLRGAALCVQAAAVKEIAGSVPEPLRAQLIQSSGQAIDAIIDEYCGTGTGSVRPSLPKDPLSPDPPTPISGTNPWAVPSPLALQLASVLVVYANTRVQSGGLQTELVKIASRLVERAFDGSRKWS